MKRSPKATSVGRATAVGAALLIILALGFFAAACGVSNTTATTVGAGTSPTTVGGSTSATTAGSGTTPTTVATGSAGSGSTVQVIMSNKAYDPATVTIKVGDTVTWVNQDSPQHDVVADNGEFKSSLFDKGGTFSFTFTKAGTYPYHCSIHPGMNGTVVVQ
jgi:plastocyanin